MPNIRMDGDVLTAIYQTALDSLPMAVQLLHRMKEKRRDNDHSNLQQKTFNKYCRQNRNIITRENKTAMLKEATQKVLNQKFGLPAVDLDAYHLRTHRNKITLSFNSKNGAAIPLTFWANKMHFGGKPISNVTENPQRIELTVRDIEQKLTENTAWLKQKEAYKQRLRELFSPTEEQVREIFKDEKPGRLDLSNCEVSNFDFSKYDLRGANLHNAKITNCIFRDMSHADLTGAQLESCDFRNSDLRYTTFADSQIHDCNISHANLEYTSFQNARPKDMDLSGSRTNHTNMDWREAENVIFDTMVDVEVAEEIHDEIHEIKEKPYEGAYLPQQTLDNVLEQHSQWMESNGKEGQRADLRGARLQKIDMSGKDLTGIKVNQHDLAGVKYDSKTVWPENIVAPDEFAAKQVEAKRAAPVVPNHDMEGDFHVTPIRSATTPAKPAPTAPSPTMPKQTPIAPVQQMMP